MKIRYLVSYSLLFLFYADSTFPQNWIVSVTPTQNQINTHVGGVELIFSRDLQTATVNEQTIHAHGSLSGTLTLQGLNFDPPQRKAIFSLQTPKAGETITITATPGIMDLGGASMPGFSWQFVAETAEATVAFTQSGAPIAVGLAPWILTPGDFDGDGSVDIAVCERNANSVSVLFNQGDGSFGLPTFLATVIQPEYLTAADFDRDGDLDLAAASAHDNNLSVFLNNSGSFTQGAPVTVLNSPHGLNSGDLNNDGYIDLLASNFGSGQLSVIINNGEGGFEQTSTPSVGSGPEVGMLADIDLDGDLDTVVPNFSSGSVSVLENDGLATFSSLTTSGTGTSPHIPAVGDLNGDGGLDFIIPNFASNSVTLLLSSGSGTFTTSTIATSGGPWSATTGDLDGDGDLDLVIVKYNNGQISIWKNDGSANFPVKTDIAVGSRPYTVAAADFDGDEALDFAVALEGANTVTILKNDVISSVDEFDAPVPDGYTLLPNFPNPFNPETIIRYTVPATAKVELKIYDITGREIRALVGETLAKGTHSVVWDGTNARGQTLPSGIYIYKLKAGGVQLSRRMILLK